jgi:hypothetical protein
MTLCDKCGFPMHDRTQPMEGVVLKVCYRHTPWNIKSIEVSPR